MVQDQQNKQDSFFNSYSFASLNQYLARILQTALKNKIDAYNELAGHLKYKKRENKRRGLHEYSGFETTDTSLTFRQEDVKRATKTADSIERLLDRSFILQQEFMKHGYVDMVNLFWVPPEEWERSIRNPAWLSAERLQRELTLDGQADNRLRVKREGALNEMRATLSQAKTNPEMLEEVFSIMEKTHAGRQMLKFARAHDLEILFAESESNGSIGGTYSNEDKKIRLVRNAMDTAQILAMKTTHEVRHAWQYKIFPELSAPQNDFDRFIALKLVEADAYATHYLHQDELDSNPEIDGQSLKDRLDSPPVEVSDDTLYSAMGLKISDTNQTKSASIYSCLFMGYFIAMLNEPSIWNEYEPKVLTPTVLASIKRGDFRDRLATSPLLQPEFLTRFCVTGDGESYLPVNPQPFIDLLAEKIARIHLLEAKPDQPGYVAGLQHLCPQ